MLRPAMVILVFALLTRRTARVSTLLVAPAGLRHDADARVSRTARTLAVAARAHPHDGRVHPARRTSTPKPVGMFVWTPEASGIRCIITSGACSRGPSHYAAGSRHRSSLYDASAIKPVLISDKVFADTRAAREAAGRRDPSPPLVNSINTMVLLFWPIWRLRSRSPHCIPPN